LRQVANPVFSPTLPRAKGKVWGEETEDLKKNLFWGESTADEPAEQTPRRRKEIFVAGGGRKGVALGG